MLENDPIQRFETEHEEALAALAELEAAAMAIDAGESVSRNLQTIATVKAFLASAVREHNEKEERALFPVLGDDAPTDQFVEEHRTLRGLEGHLGDALENPNATAQVPALAFAIIDLLRAHIERENEVLFPIAREQLGDAGLAEVARRMGESAQ